MCSAPFYAFVVSHFCCHLLFYGLLAYLPQYLSSVLNYNIFSVSVFGLRFDLKVLQMSLIFMPHLPKSRAVAQRCNFSTFLPRSPESFSPGFWGCNISGCERVFHFELFLCFNQMVNFWILSR